MLINPSQDCQQCIDCFGDGMTYTCILSKCMCHYYHTPTVPHLSPSPHTFCILHLHPEQVHVPLLSYSNCPPSFTFLVAQLRHFIFENMHTTSWVGIFCMVGLCWSSCEHELYVSWHRLSLVRYSFYHVIDTLKHIPPQSKTSLCGLFSIALR